MKYFAAMVSLFGLVYFIPLMLFVNFIGDSFEFKLGQLGTYSTYATNGPQLIVDPATGTYRHKDPYVVTLTKQIYPKDTYVEWEKFLNWFGKYHTIREGVWVVNQ